MRYLIKPSYWCGRRDLNPHDLTIERFSYPYGFRRLRLSAVCGLDYTFALAG